MFRAAKMLLVAMAVTMGILTLLTVRSALAQSETPPVCPVPPAAAAPATSDVGMIALSVAAVVGLSCMAAGYAVGRVGSAAMGAAAERPELLGRSLILVGLAEGIAIYGLIVGIMLLQLAKK